MAQHSELHTSHGPRGAVDAGERRRSGGRYRISMSAIHAPLPCSRGHMNRHRDGDADEPLAAGVVDALLAQGRRRLGRPARARRSSGTRRSRARCLRKSRLRRCRCCGSCTRPRRCARPRLLGSSPVVVKPSGLTGGKGVKVMARTWPIMRRPASMRASCCRVPSPGLGADRGEDPRRRFTIQAISDGKTTLSRADLRLSVTL